MVTDTPDGWWSSVVTRAFEDVSEVYVAWSDLKALREENARLTQMMQRIAEDVLPDPVRYDDLTPEMVRDGFIKYHMKAGAEILALRQRVNDLENACMVHHDEVARLREQCGTYFDNSVRDLEKIDALTRERDEARAEVVRMAAQRDIALVHGPEDMIRALEELTRERDEARAAAKGE